jgi:hypothetical protein
MAYVDTQEQERHQAFEALVGGSERAFRLMNLYRDTSTADCMAGFGGLKPRSRVERFRARALTHKFTHRELDRFLALQN